MDSVLYAFIWFAIALIAVTTMKFAGGWVLLPIVLVIILAFIDGKLKGVELKINQVMEMNRNERSYF